MMVFEMIRNTVGEYYEECQVDEIQDFIGIMKTDMIMDIVGIVWLAVIRTIVIKVELLICQIYSFKQDRQFTVHNQ